MIWIILSIVIYWVLSMITMIFILRKENQKAGYHVDLGNTMMDGFTIIFSPIVMPFILLGLLTRINKGV